MLIAYEHLAVQDHSMPVETNAVGAAAQELMDRALDEFVTRMRESVYRSARARAEEMQRTVYSLGNLSPNWDSYGAPTPNDASIGNAIRVLKILESLHLDPAGVLPSAEGGVGICFVRGDRYADIECSNEGEVLGVYYAGQQMPILIETNGTDASVAAALSQIRDHISG